MIKYKLKMIDILYLITLLNNYDNTKYNNYKRKLVCLYLVQLVAIFANLFTFFLVFK
jgi:hypothetical protein